MQPVSNTQAAPSLDALVGDRIHTIMWRNKITQTAAAKVINLTQGGLSKKLRGERKWELEEVLQFSKYFGVSVAYLLGETENPQPNKPTGGKNVGGEVLETPTLWVKDRDLAPVIPLFVA